MQNLDGLGTDGWGRRRERVSLEIERAALELFARFGPEEVTIEQIASAAGISPRTFFRYFVTRDEVLTAFPRRSLERISALVRSRPPSESVLKAFMEAEQASEVEAPEREVVLLWGIVNERSPLATTKALASSAIRTSDTFQQLVAERNQFEPDDPRAGAMGSAIAGVVSYSFDRWVRLGGRRALGPMITEALTVLKDLDRPPESFAAGVAPTTRPPKRSRSVSSERPPKPRRLSS